ncbi:MAG: cation diffusion facilitator family transporter [Planctomycetota bacterium]
MSVQLIALLTNIGLAVMKFVVGAWTGSRALIADAFNSAGDVVATFVAWVAFRYGMKPADHDHHYGHQNAEALAGLLLGGVICATGAFICIDGILSIARLEAPAPPGSLAIWAAGLTAVIKAVLYHYSMKVGRRTNSPTLLASARDHGADVVSGLVALVGIWIATHGFPRFDAIAGMLIGVYILYLGFEPVKSNTAILMHQAPPELAEMAEKVATKVDGITAVRQVRVQPLGGSYRMDMIVLVDGGLTVERAHEIVHDAEADVLQSMVNVTEVHMHVEPVEDN